MFSIISTAILATGATANTFNELTYSAYSAAQALTGRLDAWPVASGIDGARYIQEQFPAVSSTFKSLADAAKTVDQKDVNVAILQEYLDQVSTLLSALKAKGEDLKSVGASDGVANDFKELSDPLVNILNGLTTSLAKNGTKWNETSSDIENVERKLKLAYSSVQVSTPAFYDLSTVSVNHESTATAAPTTTTTESTTNSSSSTESSSSSEEKKETTTAVVAGAAGVNGEKSESGSTGETAREANTESQTTHESSATGSHTGSATGTTETSSATSVNVATIGKSNATANGNSSSTTSKATGKPVNRGKNSTTTVPSTANGGKMIGATAAATAAALGLAVYYMV